jgi:hypothetical protein
MTRAHKKSAYKDSGPVSFETRTVYEIQRRKLKLIFDTKKAALLSELAVGTNDRALHKARDLKFESFIKLLQGNFSEKFNITDETEILLWAEESFFADYAVGRIY